MKRILASLVLSFSLAALGMAQSASAQPSASTHVLLTPAQIQWGAGPPQLPKGARLAVLSGNPGAAGPFTIRLKFPAGYKIAPHSHPTDENVAVLSGTFSLGMGDKFDPKVMKTLPAGGYALLPSGMNHFASTRTGAIVQIHGMGPFVINYVNPADDPSKTVGAK